MVVGEVVAGRYELEELVGTGGMSSVFRAHDILLERRVALKLLHEHVGRDREQVERFRREARAVAQLSHPNIVTVIDRGDDGGSQYIVFEYVEGDNLKQLVVRQGALPVERALEIALQVAAALAFAHRHGLVHRDVKPENVLLPAGGEAKVTDFGIARPLGVDGVTTSGLVVGTSYYIAPEQARGGSVDARTDVYSLGAVLYELLTGEVPFPGESFVAVALRHVNDPPPAARDRRPEVSARLDAAIQRALAKDPDDRFGSMGELIRELEGCLIELRPRSEDDATMVVPAATAPPKSAEERPGQVERRRSVVLPLLLAALLALAAGAALAFIYYNGSGGGSTTQVQPPPALRSVPLRAVATYDPHGTGGEHDEQIQNATDRDPTTYWTTEGYRDGLQKPGVGIVLDAGRAAPLARLTVTSDTPGWRAHIQAGRSTTGPFERVSDTRSVGRRATFDLRDGLRSRYVLIWITRLAHPDAYRAHVNEVTARG